jgi:hypothetical protein
MIMQVYANLTLRNLTNYCKEFEAYVSLYFGRNDVLVVEFVLKLLQNRRSGSASVYMSAEAESLLERQRTVNPDCKM